MNKYEISHIELLNIFQILSLESKGFMEGYSGYEK